MTFPNFVAGEVLRAQDMNAVGLWKVASGTLTITTTPTNIAGVFSSEYKNYRVICRVTSRSTSNRLDMRFITGVTPNTTSNFAGGIASDVSANTTLYFQRTNNDAQIFLNTTTGTSTYILDICDPNLARQTVFSGHIQAGAPIYSFGGLVDNSNAFTGFQFFTTTGTAAMEYQVFGYQN
jgi:hypothetical protein